MRRENAEMRSEMRVKSSSCARQLYERVNGFCNCGLMSPMSGKRDASLASILSLKKGLLQKQEGARDGRGKMSG